MSPLKILLSAFFTIITTTSISSAELEYVQDPDEIEYANFHAHRLTGTPHQFYEEHLALPDSYLTPTFQNTVNREMAAITPNYQPDVISGAPHDAIIVGVHSVKPLQNRATKFLHSNPYQNYPVVLLVDDHYPLHRETLLNRGNAVIWARGGHIEDTIQLNAANLHFFGGYLRLCLKNAITDAVNYYLINNPNRDELNIHLHATHIYNLRSYRTLSQQINRVAPNFSKIVSNVFSTLFTYDRIDSLSHLDPSNGSAYVSYELSGKALNVFLVNEIPSPRK